jgi:hypothetical protein
MELEFEIDQVVEDEIRSRQNFCPICKITYIGTVCKQCGTPATSEKYFDPDFDDYMDAVEKENEELDNIKWEEIKEEEE